MESKLVFFLAVFCSALVVAYGVSTSPCACNGFVSSQGGGECLTRLKGEHWCYVNPTSTCSDKKESRNQIGQSWSYEACQQPNENSASGVPTSPCACNGFVSSQGTGECLTRLKGKHWCYVNPTSTCFDKKESRNQIGQSWSYEACEQPVSSGSGSLNIAEGLGEKVTPSTRNSVRRLGSECTTPDGVAGTCSYIFHSQCIRLATAVIQQGFTFQMINYLRLTIREPCGFQGFDFTLCCADQTSTRPTPPATQGTTTQSTTTTPPTTTTGTTTTTTTETTTTEYEPIPIHG